RPNRGRATLIRSRRDGRYVERGTPGSDTALFARRQKTKGMRVSIVWELRFEAVTDGLADETMEI
ncbi:MAG: hypothetical protein ACI8XZ_005626, partial [Gammaproteobacteria bacterium]